MVGDGVEFGLGPEGAQNGLDVVPVEIEILPRRIEISYPPEAGAGSFWTGMVDYVGGKSAEEVAGTIDASWPK